MKHSFHRSLLPVAAATLAALTGAAQAQTVIVRHPDNAAELRAKVEASLRAAERGQRVGLVSGKSDPAARVVGGTAVEQELDATTLMYSVAKVGPDGRLERACVSGSQAAQQVLAAPASFAQRPGPAKEQRDVK